jgi:fructose-1,6-bisphosphatase-3
MQKPTEKSIKSRYLDLLATNYDNKEALATEIINLESILELPKGTEHFVSDLHGEFQSFQHVSPKRFRQCYDQKLMTSSKIH